MNYTANLALTFAQRFPDRTRTKQRRDCYYVVSRFVSWLRNARETRDWNSWELFYVYEGLGKQGELVNWHVHALLSIDCFDPYPEGSVLEWMRNNRVPVLPDAASRRKMAPVGLST